MNKHHHYERLHHRSSTPHFSSSRFHLRGKSNHTSMAGEPLNKKNSGQHRGTVAMPGPESIEAYPATASSSSSDDGNSNGYTMGTAQEAANALLGQRVEMLDLEEQAGRGNGNLEASPSGHKGHRSDEERSLVRNVRMRVTRTIRAANSLFNKLARQQRDRARGLTPTGAVTETNVTSDGDGDSINLAISVHPNHSVSVGGGLSKLTRSPTRLGRKEGRVELGSTEAGMGGGATVVRFPIEEEIEGGGGPVERAVRLSETMGNLADRWEKENAGVLSRVGAGARMSLPSGHTRVKATKRVATSSLPRRASEGRNLSRYEPTVWGRDRSFRVLGVEIGHLSETKCFLVCASGVFAFLLVYGYMQEYLVVTVFNKRMGLFLTLLQFLGYATFACIQRMVRSRGPRKIPLTTYFFLGFLQACMQALTNISMMYLNYPVKVLFKSSRIIPTMCFGVLWQGRRYAWTDYVVVFLIVTGLVTFLNADARAVETTDMANSYIGILLISVALIIDAALINYQEEIMNTYDSSQDEMIMYSYLGGTIFVTLACLYTGDLDAGVRFIHHQGWWCVLAVLLFSGSGFLGVSCVAALTKRFGALVSVITTTARKAVTLMLSFVLYPKAVSGQHCLGAFLLLTSFVIKSKGKRGKTNNPVGGSDLGEQVENTLPLHATSRKRLDVQEPPSDGDDPSMSTPLLTGNGGESNNASRMSGGGRAERATSNSSVGNGNIVEMAGNAGGNPVRHRALPVKTNNHGLSGAEANGYRVVRGTGGSPLTAETGVARSPRRRPTAAGIGFQPVTGLGLTLG